MDVRERIVEAAEELFLKFGPRSVTMDELAAHLQISKKTLYQYFNNKDEIVLAVTRRHFEMQGKRFEEIHKEAQNPIHEIILIMDWISQNFQNVSPNMLYEIRKYYPKSWKLIEEHKQKETLKMIRENLGQGMAAGLYRDDIELEVMARLRLAEIEFCFDSQYFPSKEFDLSRLHVQILQHFLHGVATIKGKRMINKYLNRNEEE